MAGFDPPIEARPCPRYTTARRPLSSKVTLTRISPSSSLSRILTLPHRVWQGAGCPSAWPYWRLSRSMAPAGVVQAPAPEGGSRGVLEGPRSSARADQCPPALMFLPAGYTLSLFRGRLPSARRAGRKTGKQAGIGRLLLWNNWTEPAPRPRLFDEAITENDASPRGCRRCPNLSTPGRQAAGGKTAPLSPQYRPGIPDDDEELSETAIGAIAEGRADHAADRTFTMAEVKRDLGIEP